MHYLGLALYAEGKTDYYFLRPLLLRLCMDICLRKANRPVEISEELISLDDPANAKGASREKRIVEAAKQARGAWRIVFVHTDGAGNPARARAQLAQPAINLLRDECADDGIGVAVIPIRETEAWALIDGEALRQVFCTTMDDAGLGVPAPGVVETLLDPKSRLEEIFKATNPPARSRRAGHSPWLQALGEAVSLDLLRLLPGFQALETELTQALQALKVLH